MGRKKRPKLDELDQPDENDGDVHVTQLISQEEGGETSIFPESLLCAPVNLSVSTQHNENSETVARVTFKDEPSSILPKEKEGKEKDSSSSSGYAMTSHSADLISEDIYISDGSSDEEEDDTNKESNIELTLTASKMGLMRRGLHSQILQSKTWVRKEDKEKENKNGETEEMIISDEEKDEDVNMDPAQRATFLLEEKQKKLEEAKELKRRLESAENAGRDPCLFSKRTAFDIRMDQIEDKPWDRSTGGTGDITDYFNYGMNEEDWLEYAERQLAVRQELTDASRQRRLPDPTIVPVTPKTPSKQQPKVAVIVTKKMEDESALDSSIGPVLLKSEVEDSKLASEENVKPDSLKVLGGAWGGIPGSKIAKLIEEQEKLKNQEVIAPGPKINGMMADVTHNRIQGPGGPPPVQPSGGHYGNLPSHTRHQYHDPPPNYYDRPPPPKPFPQHYGPPGSFGERGYHGADRFPGRGDFGRGRGRFDGGRGHHPGRGDRKKFEGYGGHS